MNSVSKLLHKIHAWYYWNVRMRILDDVRVFRTRCHYKKVLPAVRARMAKDGKIRVVFLIYDLAKWKSQFVLDEMLADVRFDPIVVMTAADTDWAAPKDIVRKKHDDMKRYFVLRNVPCFESYDYLSNTASGLEKYVPEIVYYSQPWGYDIKQSPIMVSRYALTCYVPYFVPNYGYATMDCNPLFHRSVYAYFILNEAWADYFRSNVAKWRRACRYVPTGHPGLDYFADCLKGDGSNDGGYVIYAPHWSIPHKNNENDENYSRFLEFGRPMLEYAKAHPEYKWAFKPHPTLKVTLIRTGAWSREEVEAYYAEWERIGRACYTGDYQGLFLNSRLMITDCGSFLSEYGSTGRPIIWLRSSTCKIKLLEFNKTLYDTYYKAWSWEEARNHLDNVLIGNRDENKRIRQDALKQSGLLNSHASEKIVAYCHALLTDGGNVKY